mgnify:CR=1 FL=1
MLYLISKGLDPKMSFKIMEKVRKGKVKKGGFDEGWVEAMREHDVPEWYIESLAKIGYLFPKAHAVAYVMMAFRIAWYKVHEPWPSTPPFSPSGPRPSTRSTAAPVRTQ